MNTPSTPQATRRIGETSVAAIEAALRHGHLLVDVGLVSMRIRSNVSSLSAQIRCVYAQFPFDDGKRWADLHVGLDRVNGWRRLVRPQVVFRADGQQPFEPFPSDTALPLMEWGANWLIGRRMNNVLLLHAGVLERDGLTLVMPAIPGSGKSTLAGALSLRGWRLLSDEFGALDPASFQFQAVLKPVALKNQSIEVIRHWSPDAALGPEFPKTRKGRVAHLAPSRQAVNGVHCKAQPGSIVFPRWSAGATTRWEPVEESEVFSALAFNAFNYNVLGAAGFRAVVRMARQCPAWRLVYSDLEEAVRTISDTWPQVLADAGQRRAAAETAARSDP